MTAIDDATLAAWVDGELDAAAAAAVERAVRADPALARRAEAARALRQRLAAAYDPVLDEPLPPRFEALLAAPAPGPAPAPAGVPTAGGQGRADAANDPGWRRWAALAAALALGVLVGRFALDGGAADDRRAAADPLRPDAALVAALQARPTGPVPAQPLRLGASAVDAAGRPCRSFVQDAHAGLACRDAGGEWTLALLVPSGAPPAGEGAVRPASSAMPPAVLEALERHARDGRLLDAAAEAEALARGWAPRP